jgi:tRNA(fMet)-specific endonuclease VapC
MTPAKAVLDTDTLSALLRRQAKAVNEAQVYVAVHGRFTFSIITRFEILRGLKVKSATRQLAAFEQLCSASQVLSLSDEIVVRAADIYADLYHRGELIGDADILIAASALEHGLGVITNNENHFRRITGLRVENWLK